MSKGFTIIEVIVAMFILTTGILGTFSFISHYNEYSSLSVMRFTAAYLAQEGIEIVKNIRDGNYLEGNLIDDWNQGFDTVGNREADYTSTTSLSAYSGNVLNVDNSGFYSYNAGTASPFVRKIQIVSSNTTSTYISCQVTWTEKGRTHQVTAEEEIYSWGWQ